VQRHFNFTPGLRRWLLLASLLLLLLAPAQGNESRPPFEPFQLQPLMQRLQEEGLLTPQTRAALEDPRLRQVKVSLGLNLTHRDQPRDYAQFLTAYARSRAERFRRLYPRWLNAAHKAYGVPVNIILAILMVESQYGTYPPRYRPLEVFLTLGVATDPNVRQTLLNELHQQYAEHNLEPAWLENRLTTKAEWGYSELVALIQMQEQTGQALYDLKGSYAGAIGMPQFLPSSYLRWAVDGDGDRRIDLNQPADAVMSVGHYLQVHGWTPNADYPAKWDAVYAYNHSDHYVEAIFAIARMLDLPTRKRL